MLLFSDVQVSQTTITSIAWSKFVRSNSKFSRFAFREQILVCKTLKLFLLSSFWASLWKSWVCLWLKSGCIDKSSKCILFVSTVLHSGMSLEFIELILRVKWSPTESETVVRHLQVKLELKAKHCIKFPKFASAWKTSSVHPFIYPFSLWPGWTQPFLITRNPIFFYQLLISGINM